MKKFYLLTFLIFSISISYSQDLLVVELDSIKAYEIPASYANRKGVPYLAKKDVPYIFRTSDIYLMNSISYETMKRIYQGMKDKDTVTEAILKNYTATLRRNVELENQLKSNFAKSDSLDQIVYQKTQATLINTQRALDYTVNSLEKATNSLEIVEKSTKRQRRKSAFEKVLYAIGGVGIGVLVGVSL
ncbi:MULTISPECIES: hypothetical protein [Aquimarina]|uniref:Uncharacterized protein n=1 Tax=Aquimarina algiphila TaxID=2047982 RepID=A0A554VK11_9FLAO|nr:MULTISPECIES: hypothetical protein [Aquimarina]TSE08293.1 hypothetical protein FOF46_12920 [Aquimarina algiphila]